MTSPVTPGDLLESQNPLYAAIDLGSNTCRLLVVKKVPAGLEVVEAFSRIVRLGEGLTKQGRLSNEAISRTLSVLDQCARKLRFYKPHKVRGVATEACRRAKNGKQFLKSVFEKTGLHLEIISHHEEAVLALRGCSELLSPQKPYALVFDIGGGSTEVLWVRVSERVPPHVIDFLSLPYGVVTLAEVYNTETAKTFEEIRRETIERLYDFTLKNEILTEIEEGHVQMLGTSGTATTTVSFHLGLRKYDRDLIDGREISISEVDEAIKYIQLLTPHERNHNQSIGTHRGELMLGGLAVLKGIIDLWPVGTLRVADRGVREGIVADLAYGSSHEAVPYLRADKIRDHSL